MPLKIAIELLKACIFIAIGAYLCSRFMPKPKAQEPKTVFVEQKQKCEVVVKKVTKPDGSIEESLTASASSDQKTEVSQPQGSKELGIGAAVFMDKQAQVSKQISEGEFLGFKYKLDALVKIDKYDDIGSNKSIGLGARF